MKLKSSPEKLAALLAQREETFNKRQEAAAKKAAKEAEPKVEEAKETESASFTTDLGADSLETVDLIMKLEQEFDIEIPEEQANNIATVGDAIKFVENAVANK